LVGAHRWARQNPGKRILIGLSGRGDKDMPTLTKQIHADPVGT
jgi:tryptophan synthase beta chain